jgi:hypothetical protein
MYRFADVIHYWYMWVLRHYTIGNSTSMCMTYRELFNLYNTPFSHLSFRNVTVTDRCLGSVVSLSMLTMM